MESANLAGTGVAAKIDHARISELHLGGIIRPAMLYVGPRPDDGPPR